MAAAAPVPARRAHVGRWTPPAAAQVEGREGSVVCLSRGLVRCWVRTGCGQNSQARGWSRVCLGRTPTNRVPTRGPESSAGGCTCCQQVHTSLRKVRCQRTTGQHTSFRHASSSLVPMHCNSGLLRTTLANTALDHTTWTACSIPTRLGELSKLVSFPSRVGSSWRTFQAAWAGVVNDVQPPPVVSTCVRVPKDCSVSSATAARHRRRGPTKSP